MLSFAGSLKVFVAVEPCDLRKGFNGLHALVAERLGEDLKQGSLFVFSNRRHTRIKILCWDGTGIWVLTNRHTPHCPLWFIKASLPISSAVWNPSEVFGAAGGERDLVYVRLPNNTTRGVPAWMFDGKRHP